MYKACNNDNFIRITAMSYQHILVPVDGSAISLAAVKHAAQLATGFHSHLTLISLIAEDPFTGVDFHYSSSIMKEYFIQAQANAEQALTEAAAIAAQAGCKVQTKIMKGVVSAEGVTQSAHDLNADLIVMGSHGRTGLKKFILGSFAQDVLSQSELPVMIIKA